MRRLAAWIGIASAFFLTAFVAAAAFNMRSGDEALFPPKPNEAGVVIYIVSYGYHSGVVLQRDDLLHEGETANLSALRDVANRFGDFTYLEFGWGDDGFYHNVRTSADLQVGEALRALFWLGNQSVMHVVGLRNEPAKVFRSAEIAEIGLSDRGFARLAAKLDQSFALGADGHVREMGPGLYGPSLFYQANGTFNILNVCNHWVAHLLEAAGVPTNPFLATLPQGLFWDLARRAHVKPLWR